MLCVTERGYTMLPVAAVAMILVTGYTSTFVFGLTSESTNTSNTTPFDYNCSTPTGQGGSYDCEKCPTVCMDSQTCSQTTGKCVASAEEGTGFPTFTKIVLISCLLAGVATLSAVITFLCVRRKRPSRRRSRPDSAISELGEATHNSPKSPHTKRVGDTHNETAATTSRVPPTGNGHISHGGANQNSHDTRRHKNSPRERDHDSWNERNFTSKTGDCFNPSDGTRFFGQIKNAAKGRVQVIPLSPNVNSITHNGEHNGHFGAERSLNSPKQNTSEADKKNRNSPKEMNPSHNARNKLPSENSVDTRPRETTSAADERSNRKRLPPPVAPRPGEFMTSANVQESPSPKLPVNLPSIPSIAPVVPFTETPHPQQGGDSRGLIRSDEGDNCDNDQAYEDDDEFDDFSSDRFSGMYDNSLYLAPTAEALYENQDELRADAAPSGGQSLYQNQSELTP